MSDNSTRQDPGNSFGQSRAFRSFTLLYPAEYFDPSEVSSVELSPSAWHDLDLDSTVSTFATNREYQRELAKIFSTLLLEPDVIAYRQEIIADLLDNPILARRLSDLLPVIDSLARYSFRSLQEMNLLHEVAWRMGELQNIVDCIHGLAKVFQDLHGKFSSRGLLTLESQVQQVVRDPIFQNLVQALPDLLTKARACASITIGVNLDPGMRPVQATLLSINEEPFTGQSLLGKLFGTSKGREGIAPLHSVPGRFVEGQIALPISTDLGYAVDPMMVPLFADLSRILEKTARPIVDELHRYAALNGSLFTNLRQDLVFYLGAVQFVQRLRELGLPVCRPEILPLDSRMCEVSDSYNVNLVFNQSGQRVETNLSDRIIKNDIRFGPASRILILTGPNQGGKTTYMQGVGLLQVLAQAGCFVPGRQAQVSLVDQIYTHFPIEEKPDLEMGRLGEEAARMEKIFRGVTRASLVLLNESLSSTSSVESLYLAEDVVKALRRVGARVIYSTHLHELANRAAELNQSVPGDSVITSIVSSPVHLDAGAAGAELVRTYRIEMRPPLGQSFANEIAARYGIRYEQLEQVLKQRGAV